VGALSRNDKHVRKKARPINRGSYANPREKRKKSPPTVAEDCSNPNPEPEKKGPVVNQQVQARGGRGSNRQKERERNGVDGRERKRRMEPVHTTLVVFFLSA